MTNATYLDDLQIDVLITAHDQEDLISVRNLNYLKTLFSNIKQPDGINITIASVLNYFKSTDLSTLGIEISSSTQDKINEVFYNFILYDKSHCERTETPSPFEKFNKDKETDEDKKDLCSTLEQFVDRDIAIKLGRVSFMKAKIYLTPGKDITKNQLKASHHMLSNQLSNRNVYLYSKILEDAQYEQLVNDDMYLVVLAIVVTFVVFISLYVESLLIGIILLLTYLMAVGITFLVYIGVLGYTEVSQVNLIALFILMGVGTTHMFLLADAFKQSEAIKVMQSST